METLGSSTHERQPETPEMLWEEVASLINNKLQAITSYYEFGSQYAERAEQTRDALVQTLLKYVSRMQQLGADAVGLTRFIEAARGDLSSQDARKNLLELHMRVNPVLSEMRANVDALARKTPKGL